MATPIGVTHNSTSSPGFPYMEIASDTGVPFAATVGGL